MSNTKKIKFKGDGLGTKNDTAPHCFKIADTYDAILRQMPNKSDWLRQAVIEKMQRDNLIQ